MNERCNGILRRILQGKQPVKLETLMEELGISERTVRYDLDHIDDYLSGHGFPKLVRKAREGISLPLSEKEIESIFPAIYEESGYQYVFSQEERLVYIFYDLLEQDGYTTVQHLAEKMKVSKTTIHNDIKELKSRVDPMGTYLETAKGKGIKILGNEVELRKLASRSLFANFDTLNLLNISFLEIFKEISFERIQEFVKDAEKQLNNSFSDYAMNNLVIHLAIAVKRIKMSKDIVMDREELNHLLKTPEFSIAAGIAGQLEKEYGIQIPEAEIGYITIHLLGSNFSFATKENDIYLQMVISTLIARMAQEASCPFDQDEQLYENLAQHMSSAIYRFRHGININNPLLKEIKEKYKDIFQYVRNATASLAKEWQVHLSDEECGYISIHFLTSKERLQRRKDRKAKVLLVCATGVGTSKLVLMRLQSIFDFEVAGTIAVHGVAESLRGGCVDLIITTVPLKDCVVPCIQVSPFLTEKNISELSVFFSQYARTRENTLQPDAVENILAVVRRFCTVEQPEKLRQAILNVLGTPQVERPSFRRLLNHQRIMLQATAENWQEAVEIGGNLLLQDGCITAEYIQAMQKNITKLGNYMVLFPGLAMPHAKPEDGVLQSSFSILVLKKPVDFGKGVQVRVLITLAAIDYEMHTRALKELMYLLENTSFYDELIQAREASKVLELCSLDQAVCS